MIPIVIPLELLETHYYLMKFRQLLRDRISFPDFRTAVLIGVGALSSAALTSAAPLIWDNGGANLIWSDSLNWNPDGAAAANEITFDATGSSTTAGTVTNIVNANVTINTLSYVNTGTNTHATQIISDQTLTISGAVASALNVGQTGVTAVSTNVTMTGGGTLAITGDTAASVTIGAGVMNSGGATQVLEMSGLANFSANVGTFAIGNGQRNSASVTLGTTSSITATSLSLGGNTTTGGNQSSLSFGQTTTLLADTINVGNGRSGGLLQFRSTGVTNPTVSIGNRANSAGANLNVGLLDTNASGGPSAVVDFSGGSLNNAQFGTIQLGRSANGSAGGFGTGNFTFGAGSMSATNIVLGIGNNGTSATATGVGNFTMTASSGTLTAASVILGSQTQNNNTARLNGATGTFNQNGGTSAITTLTIGERSNTSTAGNVTGTYNLAGGTLKAQTIQGGNNGSGGGTVTRKLNWTGGTIQNFNSSTDLAIGSAVPIDLSAVGAQKFTADTDRSITVGSSMGGIGGFTKDGAGTLNLSGTNAYTGATLVSAGTLLVSGALGNTAVSIDSGAILGGDGSIGGSLNFAAGANFLFSTTQTLDVAGSVTFGGFGIANLIGLNNSVATGTYTLIGGTVNFANVSNVGSNNAFDLGNGKSAFLQEGSLQVVVVPEPATAILGGLGLLALFRRRRSA